MPNAGRVRTLDGTKLGVGGNGCDLKAEELQEIVVDVLRVNASATGPIGDQIIDFAVQLHGILGHV